MPNLKKNLQRNTSWAGSVAGVTPGPAGQPSLAHTGLAPSQPAAGTQPLPVTQGPPAACMHPDAIPPTTRPCAELPPKVKELLEELTKANLFYLTWTRARQRVRCEKATPFESLESLQIDFIRGKSEGEPDSLVHLWQHRLVADEKGNIKVADIDRHPRRHLSEREQRVQKQDALDWLAAIRYLPLLKDLWASLLKDNPGLEERLDAELAAMQAEVTKWQSFVRDSSNRGGWQVLGEILVCQGPEVGRRPLPELVQRQIHFDISSDSKLISKSPDRLRPVCQFPQRIGFGHDLPKSLQDKPDQALQDQTQVAALKRLGSELRQVVDQARKAKKPVRIVLRGYTDGSGTQAYNLKLSDWRAGWVEHQLRTEYGIPKRVEIAKHGCGEHYAASQAPDPEARLVVVDVKDV